MVWLSWACRLRPRPPPCSVALFYFCDAIPFQSFMGVLIRSSNCSRSVVVCQSNLDKYRPRTHRSGSLVGYSSAESRFRIDNSFTSVTRCADCTVHKRNAIGSFITFTANVHLSVACFFSPLLLLPPRPIPFAQKAENSRTEVLHPYRRREINN